MTLEKSDRLEILRRRGNPGVAPLWAAALSPEEALASFGACAEPWAKLISAKALWDLGRRAEAMRAVEAIMAEPLPKGLASIAAELKEEFLVVEVETALSEPHDDGSDGTGGGENDEALRRWLERVRRFRSAGG